MSDYIQTEAKTKAEEEVLHFSKYLKTTRESQGLSLQEAALRLHLSPRFIEMLENENLFHVNLPPIYLRGYLRSYARLLNISEQEITAVLEKLHPTPVVTTTTPVSADCLSLPFPLENKLYFPKVGIFTALFVLLSVMTTWWYLHGSPSTAATIAVNLPTDLNQPAADNNTPGQQDTSSAPSTKGRLALTPAGVSAAKALSQEETASEADEEGSDEQE